NVGVLGCDVGAFQLDGAACATAAGPTRAAGATKTAPAAHGTCPAGATCACTGILAGRAGLSGASGIGEQVPIGRPACAAGLGIPAVGKQLRLDDSHGAASHDLHRTAARTANAAGPTFAAGRAMPALATR